MDSVDLLAIQDLLALYGHVVDDADWQRLRDVFSLDGVFDLEAIGRGRASGTAELQIFFSQLDHPLAHHTTNVMIEADRKGGAHVRSKYLVVSDDGRIRTGEYHDDVVHTPSGWRIRQRTVVPRRPRPGRA